jgi:endogenous inhibitor of DNA gyrase (YacG/DUF329 family)
MDKKHQSFNGLNFCRDDSTGYYLNSTIRERMHRYVWEFYNGPIPAGFEIHHINGDKSNNDISNLQLMTNADHMSLHGRKRDTEDHASFVKRMDHARESASIWHGSAAGKEWHKAHYDQMKDAIQKTITKTCDYCGTKFETVDHGNNRFCSNKCKSAWRRKAGLDDVKKECAFCGKEFTTNKYSKAKYCSITCANKKRASDRKAGCLQYGSRSAS